ncbi:hypothetical protein [Azonexus sp. R2A61]|uniref:hypothetical protein n=1 Tax=Azonexus sp. R2A61 TaxID=2744443 RepID=UPI001F347F8F|nr:hypothetical protein [Azonexus sp. R2A61]
MRFRDDTPPTPRGFSVALIFALAAHQLHAFYEHGQWPSEAAMASLAVDWLNRQKTVLPLAERRRLAGLGDTLARQIADGLSREAGLYAAHEMMEALDPNYQSEFAQSLMKECERLFDAAA